MELDKASVRLTLINLDQTTINMRRAGRKAMDAAGKAFLTEARRRVGLRDHSLSDLADKGHPYARRHGSISIHTRKPWQVHNQSSRLKTATKGKSITGNRGIPGYAVFFDVQQAPHARYIVFGTKIMLPRDPLWMTAQDPVTKKKMMKRVVSHMGKGVRSKIGLRFGTPLVTR